MKQYHTYQDTDFYVSVTYCLRNECLFLWVHGKKLYTEVTTHTLCLSQFAYNHHTTWAVPWHKLKKIRGD